MALSKKTLMALTLLAGISTMAVTTPASAEHRDSWSKGGISFRWTPKRIWKQPVRSYAQIQYDRGVRAGRSAGWRSGYADGIAHRPKCGQPVPPRNRCSPQFRRGYMAGFTCGYDSGYHEGLHKHLDEGHFYRR